MSITPRLSFFRNNALALLALSLIGCSGGGDGTVADQNIQQTDSYKVEYVPGEMDPTQGKSEFQIILTDLTAAKDLQARPSGPTVTLMPLMYMSDKTHSTPVPNNGACVENFTTTIGTYDCTIFYVMADTMEGVSTGYWEVKVMISGEADPVYFYPSVGMAMGGTAMAKQRNSSLATMMGPRVFQVFKSGLTYTGSGHTFELFTSTMEDMMSFPPVYAGVTLNPGMGELFIDSMRVIVSDTSTFDAEYEAISASNGYWSATIPGLTNDQETILYVRVIINGNVLNNNPGGLLEEIIEGITYFADEYAAFTITPTGSFPGM